MNDDIREKIEYEAQQEMEYDKLSDEKKDVGSIDELLDFAIDTLSDCQSETAIQALKIIVSNLEDLLEELNDEE